MIASIDTLLEPLDVTAAEVQEVAGDPVAAELLVEPSGAQNQQQRQEEMNDAAMLAVQIREVRARRRRVRELRARQETLLDALHRERNASLQRREQALLDYASLWTHRASTGSLLRQSLGWNALNDCFPISTCGAYGTISGLRLGSEAPHFEAGTVVDSGQEQEPPPPSSRRSSAGTVTNPLGDSPFYLSAAAAAASSTVGSTSGGTAPARVPWSEVNAALGQVALLLSILRERPYSGIMYRHDIVPMGSASKIVVHGGSARTAGVFGSHPSTSGPGNAGGTNANNSGVGRGWTYNLHSDDSFQFFGKRNFNLALAALLECVIDAASSVRQHDDKTALAALLPYEMRCGGAGDATVGGLSFVYSPGPEWTRACKYLLANLKHLMTYRVLHLNFGGTADIMDKSNIGDPSDAASATIVTSGTATAAS
jgi:beclin 1